MLEKIYTQCWILLLQQQNVHPYVPHNLLYYTAGWIFLNNHKTKIDLGYNNVISSLMPLCAIATINVRFHVWTSVTCKKM